MEKVIDKKINSLGQKVVLGEYVYSDISVSDEKFKRGGEITHDVCVNYIKKTESILRNGYYSDHGLFYLITYNSGGGKGLNVYQTVNYDVIDRLAFFLGFSDTTVDVMLLKHYEDARRFDSLDVLKEIKNKPVIIVDRDTIVCSDYDKKKAKYKMKKNDCIEYVKNNESILKNGYYHEFDGIILLTYNSGGKDNLPVHQTVNMHLADKLSELLKIDQYSAFRIMENHSEKAKRFHDIKDANVFHGKKVIIADRDRIVCHDIIKEFKDGGEVNKSEMITQEKITLYSVQYGTDDWTETKGSLTPDLSDAEYYYKIIGSSDLDGKKGYKQLIKQENEYKFVYNLDEEETADDYPLSEYWNDDSVWSLVSEGEHEVEKSEEIDDVNKSSEELLSLVEQHYKKEYSGGYKYKNIPVYSDELDEDGEQVEVGCLQLRIANHSENVSNIDRFGSCDYYLSVVISNQDPTRGRFGQSMYERRRNEKEIYFDSGSDFDEVISEIDDEIEEAMNYVKDKNSATFKMGGEVSSSNKIFGASSRQKPKETIHFDPPLVGTNGNKLISYTWSYEWTMLPNYEGELVGKRISDWDNAIQNAETGRDIVHQYTVELKDGELKTVSSETVPILLGLIEKDQKKIFGNVATASKTLAKQQLQLQILEAEEKQRNEAIELIKTNGFPEITVEDSGWGADRVRLRMGDASCVANKDNPFDEERVRCVKDGYTSEELKKLGFNPYSGKSTQIYDLKKRIERQKKKVETMLSQKMEEGGEISDEMENFDWNSIYDIDGSSDDSETKKEPKYDIDKTKSLIDQKIDAEKAIIEDWSSRDYKSNKGIVYAGGDDVHGTPLQIGSINENRRRNKINSAERVISELTLAKEIIERYRGNEGDLYNIVLDDYRKNYYRGYKPSSHKRDYKAEQRYSDAYDLLINTVKESETFKSGGEVNKETKMDKPKNNVALYTRVKGEKQFRASDFKGNQVDRLVNAPLVSPDKFDEFLKAVKDTAEQNKGVDFRIKEFGTNKIWYDSQLSKGTEVESNKHEELPYGEIIIVEHSLKSGANVRDAYITVRKDSPFVIQFKNRHVYCLKFRKINNEEWTFYNVAVGFTKKEFDELKEGSIKHTMENTMKFVSTEKRIIEKLLIYELDYLSEKGYMLAPLFIDTYGTTYSVEKLDDDGYYFVNESFTKRGKQLENNNPISYYADTATTVFEAIDKKYKKAKEDELSKGAKVELEHKDTIEEISSGKLSPEEGAKEIAKDHIAEDPAYYDKLEEMEEKPEEEKIKFNPSTMDELKKSLSLAKSKGIAESAIYDIQKNYFSDIVSNDPTKLGEFLLAIDGLTKKERFNFQMELNDRYGNTEAIDRFSDNLEKKGYNIYDLLPTEFKKQTKVKRIDFTPSPESEGLAKITDLFVGNDDIRPLMRGVYFDKENNLISATNAHIMLVIAQKPDIEKSSICKMGANLKSEIKSLTKSLSAEEAIKNIDEKTNPDGCYEIEGRFPDYISVIPTDYSEIFDFNANYLMNYAETMSKHLTNTTTRQMLIGYKSEENGDVVVGVNAVFLATVLKGMQMLGHETLDFCHNGMANKAMVFVPKGQSRKITNKRIETDLSLCMPIMVENENDNMPIYDLTDNTIKTVAQFYGREVKQEEIAPEPVVEPTPIEVVDPIEPVVEATIAEPVAEKKSSTKIPVEKITIHWAEGDNKNYDKFPKDYKTYEDAQKAIYPVYTDFVKSGSGGYNKVKFTILFKDGEDYTGRLDVSEKEDNPSVTSNVIGQHVKDWLDHRVKDERLDEKSKKEISEWLDKYDLGIDAKEEKTGEQNENQEIKDTIDGLEILKSLAKTKKEKKEIQDTIDGLNILLEMPETFGSGGVVDRYKDFDLNEDGDFFAIVNGKEYKIIYRDDKTQLYDLFENGKKIKSSKNVREVMSF